MEVSQVAKKAIVKKVEEAFFVVFDNREIPVPDNRKQLSRVVRQVYKEQGDLNRKPEANRFTNIDPSRIIIVNPEPAEPEGQ